MSCSLMKDQMIRVISSPSSSTMGFATLILSAMRRGRLVAPAVLSVAWPTFGADLARTGFAAHETQLTPAVAAGLHERWSARLGGVLDAQPVVSGSLVVAASENGTVAGIDLASGAVRWRRHLPSGVTKCHDTPGGRYGVSATPVIAGSRVYAAANDGRVYALSLRSGKTVAGWPVRALKDSRLEHVWGALALSRGRLYVPSASHCDNAYYHGEVVAIDVRRHRMVARWSAVPGGHGGGVWAWGGLAVDATRRLIFGAPANAQGRGGEARRYGERVVALDPRLRLLAANRPKVRTYGDADFGGHPVLLDAAGCPPLLVAGHKEGALFLYVRRHVARGPLQRLQA